MSGATVHAYVCDRMFGEFLHRMEAEADVHLVAVVCERRAERRRILLRSDRWPDWMEGVEMRLIADSDKPGVRFEPVLSCALDYKLQDQLAALFAKHGETR
jgi:hypothetical protein